MWEWSQTRGVSSVVGVAILIGVVVVLSAITLALLYPLATDIDEPAPVAATEFEFEPDSVGLVVTHEAGEPLEADNLLLRGPGEAVFDDDVIGPGDSFVIEIDEPGGEFVLVYEAEGVTDSVIAAADNPFDGDLGGLPANITLAYEDLEPERSDYDYNDWVVRTETEIQGFEADGEKFAQQVRLRFIPETRFGSFTHQQSIVPDGFGSGEYELRTFNSDGEVILDESEIGTYDEDTSIEIVNSGDVFGFQEACNPRRTVELTFDIDGAVRLPSDPINETSQHGTNLPFDPIIEPSGNDLEIGSGDSQLLTVQTDWAWPGDGEHIATAYEPVGPADPDPVGDAPEFETRTWFEEPVDEAALNNCE